ncbi:MAG: hypothetical protein KF910_02290 [Brevundimonas sp.]|uniref:DUF6249 domain-containing protein n=1 Tax=Brevundimonas sp. TaxID=1871086 RepID=UPI0025B7FEEC|nr:DUF6249 domain-containing protein [Brevundimonas sp.]MBX3476413.1 hypothetical protein [Brevundimonas sp.]
MEDFIPIVAILAIFGSLTAIFVGPAYLRTREKRDVQKTVRAAIDKGQPLPPEVIDALSKEAARNLPSRTRDIRRGIIWLASGAGIALFSLVSDFGWSDGVDTGLLGLACIPATVGAAYLILSVFNQDKA